MTLHRFIGPLLLCTLAGGCVAQEDVVVARPYPYYYQDTCVETYYYAPRPVVVIGGGGYYGYRPYRGYYGRYR